MDVFWEKLKKVKLVRRHSSLLEKAVLLSVVVFSTAALLVLNTALVDSRQRGEELRAQAIALEQEQIDLQNRIDQLGTDESTRQIAREQLDLVDPDTVIIIPTK